MIRDEEVAGSIRGSQGLDTGEGLGTLLFLAVGCKSHLRYNLKR